MSKHAVAGGNGPALLDLLAQQHARAERQVGQPVKVVTIQGWAAKQINGLDRFWIYRLLEANGVESHVVEPTSVTVARRHRRAKTDAINGGALLRTLLAFRRGEPRDSLRGAGADLSGVRRHYGGFAKDVASGLSVQHDHCSQYMADDFWKKLRFLGIESSSAFFPAPEASGTAPRRPLAAALETTNTNQSFNISSHDELQHILRHCAEKILVAGIRHQLSAR